MAGAGPGAGSRGGRALPPGAGRHPTRPPLGVLLLLLVGCSSPTPDLSPVAGALPPCPPTPNCVRSEPDTDADHAIEPLPLPPGLAPADALERLAALLTEDPRTTLVARGDSWLHVATRTRWLGFVDDVVVLVRSDAGRIEVRSASRVGHGDLGVNRARIESLRAKWSSEVVPRGIEPLPAP
jgi:uncharacterized protein (DUF1499 family)